MLQRHSLLFSAILLLPTACSVSGESDTNESNPGDGGGINGGGGNGEGGSVGPVGGGNNGGAAGDGAGGAGGACVAKSAEAEPAPVDVIWAVDGSGSMAEEIERIRTQINNDFLQILMNSGLEWNLTMVARKGADAGLLRALCVNSPPAGANCGDGPNFQHIN